MPRRRGAGAFIAPIHWRFRSPSLDTAQIRGRVRSLVGQEHHQSANIGGRESWRRRWHMTDVNAVAEARLAGGVITVNLLGEGDEGAADELVRSLVASWGQRKSLDGGTGTPGPNGNIQGDLAHYVGSSADLIGNFSINLEGPDEGVARRAGRNWLQFSVADFISSDQFFWTWSIAHETNPPGHSGTSGDPPATQDNNTSAFQVRALRNTLIINTFKDVGAGSPHSTIEVSVTDGKEFSASGTCLIGDGYP